MEIFAFKVGVDPNGPQQYLIGLSSIRFVARIGACAQLYIHTSVKNLGLRSEQAGLYALSELAHVPSSIYAPLLSICVSGASRQALVALSTVNTTQYLELPNR